MIRRTALVVFLGCAATAIAAQGSRQGARNGVIAIPTIAQGYTGRAK